MERFGTVIIGGGIVGCAVAYYLTEEGESDVLVVEAEELGSGSTGGSFGGVRQQFSTPLEIEFSRRGLAFWQTAEGRFESPVPWHPNGYLFMTGRPDIMAKLAEAAALQRSMGLTEIHVLDPEQIREAVPWIATTGLLGGTYTPNVARTGRFGMEADRAGGGRGREGRRLHRLLDQRLPAVVRP